MGFFDDIEIDGEDVPEELFDEEEEEEEEEDLVGTFRAVFGCEHAMNISCHDHIVPFLVIVIISCRDQFVMHSFSICV